MLAFGPSSEATFALSSQILKFRPLERLVAGFKIPRGIELCLKL